MVEAAVSNFRSEASDALREYTQKGQPNSGLHDPDINEIRRLFEITLYGILKRAFLAPQGSEGGELPSGADVTTIAGLSSEISQLALIAYLPQLATAVGTYLDQDAVDAIIAAEGFAPDFINAFQLSDPAAIAERIDGILDRRIGPRLAFRDGFPGWTSEVNAAPGAGAAVTAPWAFEANATYGNIAKITDPSGTMAPLAMSDIVPMRVGEEVLLTFNYLWTDTGPDEVIGYIYVQPVNPVTGAAAGPAIASRELVQSDAVELRSEQIAIVGTGQYQAVRAWVEPSPAFTGTGEFIITEPFYRRGLVGEAVSVQAPEPDPTPGSGWAWMGVPTAAAPLTVAIGETFTIDLQNYGSDPDTPPADLTFSIVGVPGSALTIVETDGSRFRFIANSGGTLEITFRVDDGTSQTERTFVLFATTVYGQPSIQSPGLRSYILGIDPGDLDFSALVLPASIPREDITITVVGDIPGRTITDGVESGTPTAIGTFPQIVTATLPDGQTATLDTIAYVNASPTQNPIYSGPPPAGGSQNTWTLL